MNTPRRISGQAPDIAEAQSSCGRRPVPPRDLREFQGLRAGGRNSAFFPVRKDLVVSSIRRVDIVVTRNELWTKVGDGMKG